MSCVASVTALMPWIIVPPPASPDRQTSEGPPVSGAAGCRRPQAVLEIQVGVMRRRRGAGHVVGEDRAKARARLDAGIPFLGRLVRVPWDVAEIVEARQVRRGSDVGDREMVAGQPAPPLDEVADVIEMIGQVGVPGADRLRVRLGGTFAGTAVAPHHLL